jgi:hypothetical protein
MHAYISRSHVNIITITVITTMITKTGSQHDECADDATLPSLERHPCVCQLSIRSTRNHLNATDARPHKRNRRRNEHERIPRHITGERNGNVDTCHQEAAENAQCDFLNRCFPKLGWCGLHASVS